MVFLLLNHDILYNGLNENLFSFVSLTSKNSMTHEGSLSTWSKIKGKQIFRHFCLNYGSQVKETVLGLQGTFGDVLLGLTF